MKKHIIILFLLLPFVSLGQFKFTNPAFVAKLNPGTNSTGGGSSNWSPTNEATLKIWYEADIYTNSSDLSQISTWTNLASTTGSSYNAPGESGKYALVKLNTLNGLPAVYFAGTNNFIFLSTPVTNLFRNVAGFTVGSVLKPVKMGSSSGVTAAVIYSSVGTAASNARFAIALNDTTLFVRARRLDADAGVIASLPVVTNVTYRIVASADFVAGKLYIWTNGVSAGATNTLASSGGNTSDTGSLMAFLGNDNTSERLYGLVGNIIGFATPYNETLRTNLDNYLKKYAP